MAPSRGRLGLPTYRLDLPVDSPGALPIAPLRNQARNDKDDIRNSQYLLRPSTFSFYTRIEAAPSGERPQKRDDYKRLLCHCNHATFHIREKMYVPPTRKCHPRRGSNPRSMVYQTDLLRSSIWSRVNLKRHFSGYNLRWWATLTLSFSD